MQGVDAVCHLVGIAGTTGLVFQGLFAQMIPEVPKDFKSWPVTAILGLVTLASIGVQTMLVRTHSANVTKTAEALAKMAEASTRIAESTSTNSSEIRELTMEIRESNRVSTVIATELRVRPCLVSKNPVVGQ